MMNRKRKKTKEKKTNETRRRRKNKMQIVWTSSNLFCILYTPFCLFVFVCMAFGIPHCYHTDRLLNDILLIDI